ncbi:AAA family ATPase [Fluoribacter gormanii]|uniref:AAA family ATPase n=1 Tax=Fluoribacter gormanii TaxID=464 RepID=UPI0013EF8F78|nr:ATP-binding protein [Fluoribacter gormanii]
MNLRQMFPLGKAYGAAFCNRVEETHKLIGNIESGKHTFLVAPRRYGKSSLCEHAFEHIKFAWSKIDFHLAMNEKDVERIIINGVTDLIGKSVGSLDKMIHLIKGLTKKLQPKLVLSSDHLKLELAFSNDSSPAENIAEALFVLENLLKEKNKQAVLLLDEFQEIGLMKDGRALEGAIRHVAQETKQLALIFCGSNPHLLQNMFEDERRPLYKLCRKLVLDRISKSHYKAHLNHVAKELWSTDLELNVFDKIMDLTERHPYYVNYLCDTLCSECKELPTLEDVEKAWRDVVEEERSDLIKDFSSLAINQRRVMIQIANHGGLNIFSSEASKQMDIPINSVSRAVSALIEKDYIEKTDHEYRLIVPAFKQLLCL